MIAEALTCLSLCLPTPRVQPALPFEMEVHYADLIQAHKEVLMLHDHVQEVPFRDQSQAIGRYMDAVDRCFNLKYRAPAADWVCQP